MPRSQQKKRVSPLVATAVLSLLAPGWTSVFAAESFPLQLEVFINDQQTGLIGSFSRAADGRMFSRRSELEDLGVRVPGSGKADDVVILETVAGIGYRYDESSQSIYFTLGDDRKVPHTYDAAAVSGETIPITSGTGGVLNYTLYAAQSLAFDTGDWVFNGASASLDARVFSSAGIISQTGILGTTATSVLEALRLETIYKHSDPSSLVTYAVGDAISGGLLWTRPIRFGGAQIQRDFGLRSDLVTQPLPSFSGSAAVPSTLDIYLNNAKAFSQQVPAGPFEVRNFPALSGGTARVLLRDSAGREIESDLPFYSSPNLLRQGLTYFSLDAGFPRLAYGVESNRYLSDPVASFSARRGLYDWFTAEGHVEGGAGLLGAGVGAVARTGAFGVLSVAASGSAYHNASGFQVFAAYETKIFGLSLNLGTQRTFGEFNDLASVTTSAEPISLLTPSTNTAQPPKALDRISISMPTPGKSSLNLSFINLEPATGSDSRIVSASWTRPLFRNSQLFVTGFADFGSDRSVGMFAGFSMALGDRGSASTGAAMGRNGVSVSTDLVKPLAEQIGSRGWRIRDSEGTVKDRSVAASYRSSVGTIEAGVGQSGNSARAYAEASGAIAAMRGGVFLTNPIDDSFAVVDAGAPGVDVLYENRPAGKTNARGLVLVPNLRAYESNKISIDPKGLPINAEIEKTQDFVAPADRSGVVVSFGVKTDVKAAIVLVTDANGRALPVGSRGHLDTSDETFVVGYDGRAYVKGLGATNRITITTGGKDCSASFGFVSAAESQAVVGPIICR